MIETEIKNDAAPEIDKDAEPEIDEELLVEAQRQLGGSSRNEALNVGLRLLVAQARARRLKAFDELQRMAAEGAFDWDRLEELDE